MVRADAVRLEAAGWQRRAEGSWLRAARWYTPMRGLPMGVVFVLRLDLGQWRAYVGAGLGLSERDDTEAIAELGAKLGRDEAVALAGVWGVPVEGLNYAD